MKFSIRTQQYYNGEFRYFPIVTYEKHEYLGLVERAKSLAPNLFIKFDILDDYLLKEYIEHHLSLVDDVDIYNDYTFYIPQRDKEYVGIISTETEVEAEHILKQFHGVMCQYVPRYTRDLKPVEIKL